MNLVQAFTLYRSVFLWGLFLNAIRLMCVYSDHEYKMFVPSCWAFTTYLSIDISCMGMFRTLRRTDLLVHHMVCLVVYVSGTLFTPHLAYLGTVFMLCESISLLNSVLPPRALCWYRLFTIFAVRYPIWFWTVWWFYMYQQYIRMCMPPLFMAYDAYIVYKTVSKLK
jgi:hypothetical protein